MSNSKIPSSKIESLEPLKLYSYFRSSAAYRVRIALHLKKLAYQYHAVHLLQDGGQQHKAEYHSLNPMNEVPTLVDNGFVLSQSMAILVYLDEKWPHPRLFPTSAQDKARVIQICEMINSGIHPLQNLKVLQQLEGQFGAHKEAKDLWVQHWIMKGFVGVEKILSCTSGSFCLGGAITAADLYLIPQVFSAKRFGCDLSEFPTISRIASDCLKIEAFVQADPFHQPDSP